MAWTYSDYRSLPDNSPAAKLERCRLYMQEINDAIAADVTKGGSSRSSSPLLTLLAMAEKDEKRLMSLVASKNGNRAYQANLNGSAP